MQIAAVGRALPEHYYDQETLLAAFKRLWGAAFFNLDRLEALHRHVRVGGRHLALPIEAYERLDGFTAANEAYRTAATEVGARALRDALERAGLAPRDVDHLLFTSVTGIATPSIDALLVNRLGLRPDIKRTPLFGLGCVAGAVGITRAADYVRAFPDQIAVLLAVELCSLTLQREDLSIPNLIASGLFGDGAAAVVVSGAQRPLPGPRVVATRSVFYPDTEEVMGWQIGSQGFRVVLSSAIPEIVRTHMRADVTAFLAEHRLGLDDISAWICHPGGPKILHAFAEALDLPPAALARTWESLNSLGNLSSASVLMVLADTLADPPAPGSWGLVLAMGPGFCTEMVLLRW